MRATKTIFAAVTLLAAGACARGPSPDASAAREQVFAVERAFAKTLAERDPEAFATFISDEAVFFDGAQPLRGKAAVTAAWARYFEGVEAPFSWEPDEVEALESGELALSTGPVRDSTGTPVARFNSIWRLEAPGVWRIVFDRGSPLESP